MPGGVGDLVNCSAENSGLRSSDSDSAAICQVMRVVVFDRYGTVLHKFGCSRHLEFPNGVVANDQDEIFISDNRSHCVKVTTVYAHSMLLTEGP